MLKPEAEFPLPGSTAYLRPDGLKCRIHQRLPGGLAIVSIEERFKKASSSRRVALDELAPTEKEAHRPQPRSRRAA